MTSPAIPAAILTRMRAGHQAVRWKSALGHTYQFRAHCCNIDSDGVMGVAKQPVPVLEISPNPVCSGSAMDWDLTHSYAPGAAAITELWIAFGDGSPDSDAGSGAHIYTLDPGVLSEVFTVVGTAVAVAGANTYIQSIEVEVEVIDCDNPLLVTFSYVATDGDGVYFIDFTDAAPTWTARNTGLEGDALNVNSLVLRPGDQRLPNTIHELYAATNAGVYRTYNGGRSWEQISLPEPSNAEFLDAPPATLSELVFYKVVYSPDDYKELWVLAGKISPDRLWVYHTEDDSMSWNSRGLKVE